jgi:hypothetical protein
VASNKDAEALLDTANSASQHVAVLHVAFMALCAYVLIIVFGTTVPVGRHLPASTLFVPASRQGLVDMQVRSQANYGLSAVWSHTMYSFSSSFDMEALGRLYSLEDTPPLARAVIAPYNPGLAPAPFALGGFWPTTSIATCTQT